MGDNPVFKALYFKPRLIRIEKNTVIPASWTKSSKSIAVVEDPENINDEEVGIVSREQRTNFLIQPQGLEIYDFTQTLRIYTSTKQRRGEPFYRLDPLRAYSHFDKDFLSAFLFRTLFKYDSDGNLLPDMAVDFGTATENYKIWTFKIRCSCFFENGKEIMPSDIAYGISRRYASNEIINLNLESPHYPIFILNVLKDNNGILYKGPYDRTIGYCNRQLLFNNAVKFDDIKKTIIFSLKRPTYDFRDMLTCFCFGTPVPVNSCLPNGTDIDFKPISSGPYKIDECLSMSYITTHDFGDTNTKPKRYSKLVLGKNPWWNCNTDPIRKGKNYQSVIEINFGQPSLSLIKLILSDSDKNAIVIDSIPQNIYNPNGTPTCPFVNRAFNFNNGFVSYLGVNCKLITSNEIRQAIYYAIDPGCYINAKANARGYIISSLYASQTDTYISPYQYDYVSTLLKTRPNIEYAKILMNTSKNKNLSNYNYVTSSCGITLTLPDMCQKDKAFVQTWIGNFAKIGIKLNICYVSNYYSTLFNREKTENLTELTLFTWSPDWDSATNVFRPIFINDDLSPIHLVVNQYDSDYNNIINLINNAAEIENQNERKLAWQQIQNILLDEMWVIPFCVNNQQIVIGSKIRGLKQKFQTISYNDIYIVQ
jgi:peptide/nickel transport system substrate-binding protein